MTISRGSAFDHASFSTMFHEIHETRHGRRTALNTNLKGKDFSSAIIDWSYKTSESTLKPFYLYNIVAISDV